MCSLVTDAAELDWFRNRFNQTSAEIVVKLAWHTSSPLSVTHMLKKPALIFTRIKHDWNYVNSLRRKISVKCLFERHMINPESLNETTAWLTFKVQLNWSTFVRNPELYSKFRFPQSSEDLLPILLFQIRDMPVSQFYWFIKIWKNSCYWDTYICFTYQQKCLKSENLKGHKADFCRQYCLMLVFKETWWTLRSFFPLHKWKRL